MLRRLTAQDGMTLIEVVVAALVLALGSLAVLSLVSAGARNSYRAEQSQVVSDRLQYEMEKAHQLADSADYDRIALSQAPAASSDPNDPAYRVSGTSYAVNRDGTGLEPMLFNGGGLAPVSSFSSGDVHGTIHRFVVKEPSSVCPPPNDGCLKRVIVSIALDSASSVGARRYQEIQSLIADPRARTGPCDGCGSNPPTPWTFWLTDTPCSYSDRQELVGDADRAHLTHNTNGECSAGLKDSTDCTTVVNVTSCPPGAPDLMVTHPPPVFSEEPLYNFAKDVLSSNPAEDKGLRTFKASSDGCQSSLFQPLTNAGSLIGDPSPVRSQTIHKWVSLPIPSGSNVQLDGHGVLNLWTRTVGGVPYSGRICVWLFQRQLSLLGTPVDTPAANLDLAGNPTYFQYSASDWPSDEWGEVQVPLHFNLNLQLVPNSRLGIAVQVERAGTGCPDNLAANPPVHCGLQFIYDEPSYESRLEVKTTSLLPF
jgi:prepilin-type N-terminal cleavage/methylation domain-containing protein